MSGQQPHRIIRQLVVEALYESDSSDHEPATVLQRRLADASDEEEAPNDAKFRRRAGRMLDGVLARQPEADIYIAEAASQYPLETMAVVDRNILRLAIWELLSDNSAPVAAVVNEAVELARRYGGETSPSFVNGVLRTVSERIQAARTAEEPPGVAEPESDTSFE